MSDYYETRQEILKKIHQFKDLLIKTPMNPPSMVGNLNEIFKAIRDGSKSDDINYVRICFQIILDHIILIDNKCDLTDGEGGGRLKQSLEDLQKSLEIMTDKT